MHYGIVNEHLEPIVRLNVLGADGAALGIDFVIDTGCSEEIILPQHTVDELHRTSSSDMLLAVGDGTISVYARYRIVVTWHGQPKEVTAVSMGTEPLLGMGLLQGSNLNFDAAPNGLVTITELPAQP